MGGVQHHPVYAAHLSLARVKGPLPTGSEEEAATESQADSSNTTSLGGASSGGGKGGLWAAIALVLGTVLVVGVLLVITVLLYSARFGRRRRPQYLGNCRNLNPAQSRWT